MPPSRVFLGIEQYSPLVDKTHDIEESTGRTNTQPADTDNKKMITSSKHTSYDGTKRSGGQNQFASNARTLQDPQHCDEDGIKTPGAQSPQFQQVEDE